MITKDFYEIIDNELNVLLEKYKEGDMSLAKDLTERSRDSLLKVKD